MFHPLVASISLRHLARPLLCVSWTTSMVLDILNNCCVVKLGCSSRLRIRRNLFGGHPVHVYWEIWLFSELANPKVEICGSYYLITLNH